MQTTRTTSATTTDFLAEELQHQQELCRRVVRDLKTLLPPIGTAEP